MPKESNNTSFLNEFSFGKELFVRLGSLTHYGGAIAQALIFAKWLKDVKENSANFCHPGKAELLLLRPAKASGFEFALIIT